jgi:hypothetical protein
MKTLYESLLDDFDTVSAASTTDIKKEIKQFLKDNYKRASSFKISKKPNNDGYYEVDCSKCPYVIVSNKNITSLTNNLFIFVNVKVSFVCSDCKNLTSLEGSPKEVGGDFHCPSCDNLTSLEGAPNKVGGDFGCYFCANLTSLEGAPKEVGKDFCCTRNRKLTSLEGAPENVGWSFDCSYCDNLTSLEGAPQKVGGSFICHSCTNLTSLEGAPQKVGGNIYSDFPDFH